MRYKALISYSHRDEATAKRLHLQLERFRPPRGLTLPGGSVPERLYPIFRDREEMSASPSLPATIEAAVKASGHLIVLCSPASAASAWVNQEITLFVEANGPDRVLPVIISGDPADCFPKALKDALDEPLAPDLREGKDGYNDGVLKIIAALWGVPFGALKDRDAVRQRRRARLNAALAAAFAGLVVFAGFFGWRATEQEQRAKAEAQVAEARSLASVARFTFDRNPGETSVAAMIAAQSLRLKPTPEAHDLLRDALKLAPLGATASTFPWLRPNVVTSQDGNVAAFMSVYSFDEPPARSSIVRLSPELDQRDQIAFEGLVEPVLSTDGEWMAATGRLRRLYVQNLITGEVALNQPTNSGFAATFSSNSATLYAATQLGKVLRWSPGVAKASSVFSTPGGGDRLTLPSLSLSPADDVLLRSETAKPSMIIPLNDGAVRQVPFLPKYKKISWREHTPQDVLAHPNAAQFIAYDNFNAGALRDLKTMEAIWSFDDKSRSSSWTKANAISGDGAYYARGRGDGVVIVRDMTDGSILHRSDHGGVVRALAFLDPPSQFVTAGDGGVAVWDIGEDRPTAHCEADAKVLSIALEARGSLLLGTQDGRLIRCDPKTGVTLIERHYDASVTSIAAASGEIAIAVGQLSNADNWTEVSFLNRMTGASSQLSLNQSFDQLKLNKDGSYAAMRSWPTREVSIWNTKTGELVNQFSARGDIIGLTADGGRLLMNYEALDIFDIASGQRLSQLGEPAGISSLIVSAYQGTLITRGQIDGVQEHWAWNAETGERQWRAVGDIVMSPDGSIYAELLKDKGLWRVVKRATGEEVGAVPFQGDDWGATLSPKGANITLTSRISDADGNLRYETALWDAARNQLIWKRDERATNVPSPRVVFLSGDRAAYVHFSRDDAGAFESGIDIFDWTSGKVVFSVQWPGFGAPRIEASPNGNEVLIAAGGKTTLYRLSDGDRLWSVVGDYSRSMAFSPNGDFIVAGRPDSGGQDRIVLFDRSTGALIQEWTFDLRIQDIGVTSDGSIALAALESDDWSGIRGWRIEDGGLVFELELDATPRSISPLSDPNRIIVVDYESSVRTFDLSQSREVRRFPMAIRTKNGAVSADGARAITATGARIRYWDAASGEQLDTYLADGQITRLALSGDGAEVTFVTRRKRKARGGVDTPLLQIWRPSTSEPIDVLAANKPQQIAYDPTDEILVIGSGADERRVFDARTLAPRFTVRPLANGTFETSSGASKLFTLNGDHFAILETASYGQANTSEKRAALRVVDVATGAEIARFDVAPAARGIAATQNGFYYNEVSGRSRHFEISENRLDRVLIDEPREVVGAIPGGDFILASGYRGGDALINVHSGDRIDLTIKSDTQTTVDSAIDPSGRYVGLSQVREDGEAAPINEILIFDAKTGKLLSKTQPLQMPLRHIAFAEGGEAVIAAELSAGSLISRSTEKGRLYKWRWRKGQPTTLIEDNPVANFKVSGDGGWLVTSEGGENQDSGEKFGQIQTRLTHLTDERVLMIRPTDHHSHRLAISADGKRLGAFSATSPPSGAVMELRDGGVYETLLEISFNDALINGEPLGFIDGGAGFVFGERSGARVFNLETGSARRVRVPGRAKRYALSADGAFLAIGGDTFVSIWDLTSFEQIISFEIEELRGLTFADADGRSLIAETNTAVVRLEWDQEAMISSACRVFQNDVWGLGKDRIVTTDAPEACER